MTNCDIALPIGVATVLHRAAQEIGMAKRLSKDQTKEEGAVASPEAQPPATEGREAEEIARLAHEYWLERGTPIGTPEEDWFRAEEAIRLRRQQLEQEGNDD